ncbi:MAG: fibronectin type III domain-containing protein, partial [Actinobacteria bacterium]|nr:fibronectin type III domain-containing protein [Actinomycetota bacterium]
GLAGATAHTFKVVASSACGDGPAATSAAATPTGATSTYVTNVLANAPVAYYRLGEGSGLTAADSSGKAAHGTYESATLGSPGAVLGDADTSVNGNANGQVASSSPALPLYNSARSVEAWVKPADGNNRYVASWGTYYGNDQEFSVLVGPNQVGVVTANDDRYFPTPRAVNDGAWHHVVVTYDGTTLGAYLDGVSLGTRTFSAPLDTIDGSRLHVGARFDGQSPFYGDLDEVAVFPSALTATQVGAHFSASGYSRPAAATSLLSTAGNNQATIAWTAAASPTPITRYVVTAYAGTVAKVAQATDGANTSLVIPGLAGGTPYTFQVVASNAYGDGPVATSPAATPTGPATTYASGVLANAPLAYYRLGEASGKTAADSSGKGRHGTYEGASLGSPGAVVDDQDTSVSDDGSAQAVRSAPSLPGYNSARSVEAWVKPADGYDRYVASWGTSATDQEFSVLVGPNQVGVVGYYDDRYFATPRPLTDGAWHHVVVTYNGTTLTAYLDGVVLGSRSFGAALDTIDGSGLHVGARLNGQSP